MKMAVLGFGIICVASFGDPLLAQEGLATSGGIGGHNTIQQAPSGGRVGADQVVPKGSASGIPTAADRKEEKREDGVTDICKGC